MYLRRKLLTETFARLQNVRPHRLGSPFPFLASDQASGPWPPHVIAGNLSDGSFEPAKSSLAKTPVSLDPFGSLVSIPFYFRHVDSRQHHFQ